MLFSSLDLDSNIQKALDNLGYNEMTPVQEQAIIPARRGRDILACAQTGTGKTAAFAIPILQRLLTQPSENDKKPRALILTPTRELAEQLAITINAYAEFSSLTVHAVYGGKKASAQQNKLKAGVDVLIATPGRLIDHISQAKVDLSSVEYVVLDEVDRMLDMGFVADAQTLLNETSDQRQTLFFSATLSPAVNELAHKLLTNHIDIRVSKDRITADTVEHVMYPIEEHRKIELFKTLLEEENWFRVLVFTSTKMQADKLMASLKPMKIKAAICHGDKSQSVRRRAIADFKSAKLQVLIATEVAARGLDIEGLEHVVNYNLPYLPEDYVHRIGRTGRAGNKGQAISLVSREEEKALDAIQRVIGSKIQRIHRPDFEVGSRDTLIKTVEERKRPARTNKASKTIISDEKKKKKTTPSYAKKKKGKK